MHLKVFHRQDIAHGIEAPHYRNIMHHDYRAVSALGCYFCTSRFTAPYDLISPQS